MTTRDDARQIRWLAPGLALALGLATVLTFFGVWNCGFVDYDDNSYVFLNPHVVSGLTWKNAAWAMTHDYASNWHPMTWLSHMLDAQLFGLWPGGHHLTNLLLHTTNVVLLFLLLNSLTGALGSSAFVAALFALHPLHVESVAWVAERKDVLSAFFFFLTLWAYARYAQSLKSDVSDRESGEQRSNRESTRGTRNTEHGTSRPAGLRAPRCFYVLSLLFFALGLMSKPMIVTLPFVLLLLDYWPLGRFESKGYRDPVRLRKLLKAGRIPAVLWEKLPFFALSAASCVVTLVAQARGEAIDSLDHVPLGARLSNALMAYFCYLQKMVWPSKLAVLYLRPPHWPIWEVGLVALILVILSALVLALEGQTLRSRFLRRSSSHASPSFATPRPYLLVGWLWFLGMLVPVTGLVQVGNQFMADRYTYLPSIGIFVLMVWGLAALAESRPTWKLALSCAGAVALFGLAATAHCQVAVWRDTQTLFTQAARVVPNNYQALTSLANLDLSQGRVEAAMTNVDRVLQIEPGFPGAEYIMGAALQMQGRMQDAIQPLQRALLTPDARTAARARLVLSYLDSGRLSEAENTLDELFQVVPGSETLLMKAALLHEQGRSAEAAELFTSLMAHHPKFTLDNPTINFELAELYSLKGENRQAAPYYSRAIEMRPEYTNALNNFAWVLATDADEGARNGPRAVQLAERACRLTQWTQPVFMGTLAAAFAEAGRFEEAVKMAERARDLARAQNQGAVADRNAELLEVYKQRKPWREPK